MERCAWLNKKPFKANEVGIAYMLAGDVGSSNTDPYADAPTSNNQWVEPFLRTARCVCGPIVGECPTCAPLGEIGMLLDPSPIMMKPAQ